jgi:hypothetical protein
MDPVALIVTAVVAGIAAAAKPTAEQAVRDAYTRLKTLIQRRFADKGDVTTALDQVENKPESAGRQEMLKEELDEAEAGQDADVVEAARELLALLQPQGADQRQIATADHGSAAATGRGVAAVGDGNIALTGDIQGGVTIGQPSRKKN